MARADSSTCSRNACARVARGWRLRSTRSATGSARTPSSARVCWAEPGWCGTASRSGIQATLMNPGEIHRDIPTDKGHDATMASRKEEAAGAAWQGADLERPISGENPESESLEEARRWVRAYGHLVTLEQALFDLLAKMIPGMPGDAQREAELTNLPVIASQVERFRHRLDYWVKRERELEGR